MKEKKMVFVPYNCFEEVEPPTLKFILKNFFGYMEEQK